MNRQVGPRVKSLILNEKFDSEDIPEEPQSPIMIVDRKKIQYTLDRVIRFDKKGHPIVKGTNYGICFDNYITVCLYEIDEEVICLRDTLALSNLNTQQKNSARLDKTSQDDEQQDTIILRSILKKRRL